MRNSWSGVAIAASCGLAAAAGSCDKAAVNDACVEFCEQLVEAMDGSDWYDLSAEGVNGTTASCKRECTQSISEFDRTDQQADVEDCVECIADNGFDYADDNWTMGAIMSDVGASCGGACDDSEVAGLNDYQLAARFLADFSEDFDEHWSNGVPGGDVDGDTDIDGDVDSDADGDTDTYDTDTLSCDTTALNGCYTAYSECYDGCYDTEGYDTDCYDSCLVDYCGCAEAAGCAEEVSGSCG